MGAHRKFFAFKILLIVGIVQEHIVAAVASGFAQDQGSCMSWEGEHGEGTHLSMFWNNWLTLAECVPGAIFMRVAFPASEILDYRELSQRVHNIELELEQEHLETQVGIVTDS